MNSLRILRKKLGLTQQEMAKILNVGDTTYSAYENEKIQLNAPTLIKLADYFNTTTDNILGRKTKLMVDISTLSNLQIEIIEKIKNCNEKDCLQINSYMDGLNSKK